MKLVLLPGMDGTGKLFKSFLDNLGNLDDQIVMLPMDGSQNHQSLIAKIRNELPSQDCLLLAESCSGPIAAQ